MMVLNLFTDYANKLFKLSIFIIVILMLCVFYLSASFENKLGYSTVSSSLFKKIRQMTEYSLLGKKRIHIVVVGDKNALFRYKNHGKTLLCYAHRHGYQYSPIDPSEYYTCTHMINFYFKKHCAVMLYLIQHPDVEWLLVLDGDTFVVNATKSLESFIPDDPNIHVIHYERFWHNEIMAGNYIIRNHPWSLLYLNKWVESFTKMPNVRFHNNDNGVLHLHFLDMVGKLDADTNRTCLGLYKKSDNEQLYMKYVACTKCALKGQRKFFHIILHRKGHSFCRDSRLPIDKIHQLDFMLHGYKQNPNNFFEEPVNPTSCLNDPNWTPKIRQSLIVPDLLTARRRMREWEEVASKVYTQTIVYPEIADCWPNCEPEITGAKLDNYTFALCNYRKFL